MSKQKQPPTIPTMTSPPCPPVRAEMASSPIEPVRAPEVQKESVPKLPAVEIKQKVIVTNIHEEQYVYESIATAPRNGSLIVVSETGDSKDKGSIVLWRKTRAFANATHRWENTGFFVNNITNLAISFTPKYWRPRKIYEI